MTHVLALVGALTAAAAAGPAMTVLDIAGRSLRLFEPQAREVQLLFFLSTDCPISNRYAPEITRICGEYAPRGVRCVAVYPDAADAAAVKRHRQEFGFPEAIAGAVDRDRRLVRAVGPRVTPEAAVFTQAGRVYRGRIDDLYVDIGRMRRTATTYDVREALDAVLAGRPVTRPETEAIGCSISGF
jgi:hypothetical protein